MFWGEILTVDTASEGTEAKQWLLGRPTELQNVSFLLRAIAFGGTSTASRKLLEITQKKTKKVRLHEPVLSEGYFAGWGFKVNISLGHQMVLQPLDQKGSHFGVCNQTIKENNTETNS